jgi:succinate-semialdehyde dehydrogenase/glutarate-semialdehyde dehydrogenase
MSETQPLIRGRWIKTAESFSVVNPADGRIVAEVGSASPDDAETAVEAATEALPGWAATAPRARAEILRRTCEAMLTRIDDLARLIVLENGKPLADARSEVTYAAEFLRWYSEQAVQVHGTVMEAPSGGAKILTLRQPIGVALLITPWNLPLAMATRKVAPALAAGCTAILKPAGATPLSSLAFAAMLAEQGLPPGVLGVLPTSHTSEVVDHILAARSVRKLSFTGSTEVGRVLLAKAANRVISCSMELGGNAPVLVFEDADLNLAVTATVVAKMRHNAEACTAANRIYVEDRVADEFAQRLAEAMQGLRLGPGLEPDTQVGPLIDERARKSVHRLTEKAIAEGATPLTGAQLPDGDGYFYPPTVLTDVEPNSSILREEIFGPVAPIVRFSTLDEAIGRANDSEHGLMSYVFSADLARALRIAEQLESGMVAINRGVISDPAAPFGGVKQSGIGREGGLEGLLEYTETKYIGVDW